MRTSVSGGITIISPVGCISHCIAPTTRPCEERDGSNGVTKRYYPQGMQIGSTNYYTRDRLGWIRELASASGVVVKPA